MAKKPVLGQVLWQNVHLIRGKVPGRTRSSQVLWGSERLIKERAKEPYKYAGTKGRSAARQRRSHQKNYQRGMKACYIIPLLWWLCMWHYLSDPMGGKLGFYGNGEMKHWRFCSCDSQQKNATLHKGPENHWETFFFFSSSIRTARFCLILASAAGLELLSFPFTIIV